MGIEEVLVRKKVAVLKKWFDLVVDSYPPETARFLKKESNQFANPVGQTIYHGMEGLLEELFGGMDPEKISPFLDSIIRIRAIQSFSPSQAIAFIFQLKKVVKEVVENELRDNRISPADLETFQSQVDQLALLAFDIYMGCREKLCEVRVNEVKNRTFRLLQRANLITEIPEEESESKVPIT